MASVGGRCTGSCEATAEILTKPQNTYADAWKALSILIGLYAYVKAFELGERMVVVAERAQDRADRYYDLAKDNYDNKSTPIYTRLRDLYDRYTTFWNRENDFITCAFSKKEYCADYALQEGRAIGRVAAIWDRSARNMSRGIGKYNTGRACHNATHWSILRAQAMVDAANVAYRYEDQKKVQMDMVFWQRWKDGAMYVSHMGDRGANGLNGASNAINNGLSQVARATELALQAARDTGSAYATMANMYSGLGNQMFKMGGFSAGMGGGFAGGGHGGGGGGGFNSPYGDGGGGGDSWGDGGGYNWSGDFSSGGSSDGGSSEYYTTGG